MHANEAQNRPGEKTANECSSRCPIPHLLQRLLHNFVLLKPSQVLVDFVEVDIISGEVQVAQIELELGMGGKGVLEGGRLDRERGKAGDLPPPIPLPPAWSDQALAAPRRKHRLIHMASWQGKVGWGEGARMGECQLHHAEPHLLLVLHQGGWALRIPSRNGGGFFCL